MNKTQLRRLLGVVILIVSLVILLWALWPLAMQVRSVPVVPADMQLPESYLPQWLALV